MASAVIFLLFLTVIGVTLLQASVLEQRMAVNTQQSHRVFHAAESGLLQAFRFALNNRSALVTDANLRQQRELDGVHIYTRTQKIATSTSPPRGFSLRGVFRTHHFVINADARMAPGARSSHAGGLAVIGPGGR